MHATPQVTILEMLKVYDKQSGYEDYGEVSGKVE